MDRPQGLALRLVVTGHLPVMVGPALSGVGATIAGMWIVIDPENPHRRTVFGSQEVADGFARQLEPPWRVMSADDPDVAPVTGQPPAPNEPGPT